MKDEKLKITLLLDTSSNKEIIVGLIIDGKKDIQTNKIAQNDSQIILQMIDKILKKHLLKPEEICGIKINPGPGSFTGLRIGLAIANAFSFVYKIPVNGKNKEIILPIYT
jgi:tRNA threonylcarbamoyladenosine biosynthesis protein TsaB